MISQWSSKQWMALHNEILKPADLDIVHAVIEGAGLLEPSEWAEAEKKLAPWVHISSIFTNVANYSNSDVSVFLREIKRYVPQDAMMLLTLRTLVHTLVHSIEHAGASAQHWNEFLGLLGGAIEQPMELQSIGEWSL